jgi:3-dehydroquinate synthase
LQFSPSYHIPPSTKNPSSPTFPKELYSNSPNNSNFNQKFNYTAVDPQPEYLFAPADYNTFIEYLHQKEDSGCRFYILTDENTKKHCLPAFVKNTPHIDNYTNITIASGEANKNIKTCETIWKTLTDDFAGRNSLLINLGGGVISDIGGFAASVYKRGIPHCNVPTSLLGMIDAAVGGKTGVDFLGLKNMIGLFSTAEKTYIDSNFLHTLPEEHLCSGYAELLKIALISDRAFWEQLSDLGYKDILSRPEIISTAVQLKNNIVLQDPKEQNIRKTLNFGHTIGHAVESYSIIHGKNPLLHGDSVAIGMICETWLSNKVNGLSDRETKAIIDKIAASCGKHKLNIEKSELLRMIRNDKKNAGSKISFTLLNSIGSACIDQHFSEKLIFEALDYYYYL